MIDVANVSYTYAGLSGIGGNKGSLHDINLSAKTNQITAILGHSGSGKSTLLRLIAGLFFPQSGSIKINGVLVSGCSRETAIVSANTPLYPWMTVEKNIAFALCQYTRQNVKEKTAKIIRQLDISDFSHKYPVTLSSGMTKQAMLARAFVVPGTTLLLDEPFSEIDPPKRIFYHDKLLEARENRTILLVTHDIEEAITLSDQIYLLDKNRGTITKNWRLSQAAPDHAQLKDEILAYYHSSSLECVS